VQPVDFKGRAREDLDEGTLSHVAVLAAQRGQGLCHLLLGRATDTLPADGVWRISCDTATENAPKLRLFEKREWIRLQVIEVAIH
jgi:ribosomal protein S18 acetylase RimI-like enzyme